MDGDAMDPDWAHLMGLYLRFGDNGDQGTGTPDTWQQAQAAQMIQDPHGMGYYGWPLQNGAETPEETTKRLGLAHMLLNPDGGQAEQQAPDGTYGFQPAVYTTPGGASLSALNSSPGSSLLSKSPNNMSTASGDQNANQLNNPLLAVYTPEQLAKSEECYNRCQHLMGHPDLQTTPYRKCYRECMGTL